MVTKLRNIRYSTVTKVIAVILAWLSFIITIIGVWYLDDNENIAYSSSYFDTYQFQEEYSRTIHNVVEYYVKLKSEENIRSSGTDEAVIQNNLERYSIIKDRLSKQINFVYYIKDKSTGETITNTDTVKNTDFFTEQESMAHFYNDEYNYPYFLRYHNEILEMLQGTSYEVYTAVVEPLKKGDVYYENYISYEKIKNTTNYWFIAVIVSLSIMILMLVYLFYSAGRKNGIEGISLSKSDKIYLEIHTLMVFIAAIISLWFLSQIPFYVEHTTSFYIPIILILSVDFFIGLAYLLSITRKLKSETIRDNYLVLKVFYKVSSFVKLCFNGKLFKTWILLFLSLYVFINSVLSFVIAFFFERFLDYIFHGYYELYYGIIFIFATVLFIAMNIFVFYMTAKSLKSLPEIMEAAKQISSGNLDYQLNTTSMSVTFSTFAENIQSIQGGLKKAVDEAIKGERMKTDLITNVSHDLKTPLTSIINYVDLLKKEPMENQKAQEYINVLDEKSTRLKALIEDLIEASKASSGNLSVDIQKVDLCELVMQAFGEYREKFEKCGLDIRTSTVDKNIFVQADGKHMWRIIENLLSNVLKYSMKNSRVYISLTRSELYGVLTIKNISELPLEMPVEQLTERFVRGDISRTTEGSGLGLSIAQSLTNMQKGNLNIEIDGDLFKVVLEIPLWS